VARTPSPFVLAGIGALNTGCWLAGAALGWLIDGQLHTLPLFILVGLAAGISLGAVATYHEVRRYLSK